VAAHAGSLSFARSTNSFIFQLNYYYISATFSSSDLKAFAL
jgi:hypothetical protein